LRTKSKRPACVTAAACSLMMLGAASIDLYLPSLPAISDRLGASATQAQLTLSCYLFAYALVQPLMGPVAERLGRRPVIFLGLFLCALGALGCATADSIHQLYAWRAVQGLGCGVGSTLCRVLLRDVYSGPHLSKRMSYVAIAWGGAPLVAPVIGGYLQAFLGWRSPFFVLFLLTLALFLFILIFVHETRPNRPPVSKERLFRRYRTILTHKEFLGFTFTFFCVEGLMVSYATASPILLQEDLGLSPVIYGWMMLIVAVGFMGGSLVNSRLVDRLPVASIMRWAVRLALVGAIWFMVTGIIGWESVALVVITMCAIEFAIGHIFPNAMAGAVHPFSDYPATASSLFGCIATLGGASFSWIVAHLSEVSQLPLAILMVGQLSLAYLLLSRVAFASKVAE